VQVLEAAAKEIACERIKVYFRVLIAIENA
jgi:hypothetical protein